MGSDSTRKQTRRRFRDEVLLRQLRDQGRPQRRRTSQHPYRQSPLIKEVNSSALEIESQNTRRALTSPLSFELLDWVVMDRTKKESRLTTFCLNTERNNTVLASSDERGLTASSIDFNKICQILDIDIKEIEEEGEGAIAINAPGICENAIQTRLQWDITLSYIENAVLGMEVKSLPIISVAAVQELPKDASMNLALDYIYSHWEVMCCLFKRDDTDQTSLFEFPFLPTSLSPSSTLRIYFNIVEQQPDDFLCNFARLSVTEELAKASMLVAFWTIYDICDAGHIVCGVDAIHEKYNMQCACEGELAIELICKRSIRGPNVIVLNTEAAAGRLCAVIGNKEGSGQYPLLAGVTLHKNTDTPPDIAKLRELNASIGVRGSLENTIEDGKTLAEISKQAPVRMRPKRLEDNPVRFVLVLDIATFDIAMLDEIFSTQVDVKIMERQHKMQVTVRRSLIASAVYADLCFEQMSAEMMEWLASICFDFSELQAKTMMSSNLQQLLGNITRL